MAISPLARFARMLRIPIHQAEDAIRNERAARAVLTRRNLLVAGAALAAGSVFSFPKARESGLILAADGVSYGYGQVLVWDGESWRGEVAPARPEPSSPPWDRFG